jgi:hypothetical protein
MATDDHPLVNSPDRPARLLVMHNPCFCHGPAQLKEAPELVFRVACSMVNNQLLLLQNSPA